MPLINDLKSSPPSDGGAGDRITWKSDQFLEPFHNIFRDSPFQYPRSNSTIHLPPNPIFQFES